MTRNTYIFFNKFHDIFRVKASCLKDAIAAQPKDFHYEYFEVVKGKTFPGVPEV